MRRVTVLLLVSALIVTMLPVPAAWPYSADDTTFYDGVSDLTAFVTTETANVVRDPLGGLRLASNGATQTATWTTAGDFAGGGSGGPLVGVSTLSTSAGGGGTPGAMTLRQTALALEADTGNPAVSPTPVSAGLADTHEVQGPSVVKSGSTYQMFYTGVASDGYVQRVFEATSSGGTTTWNKVTGPKTGGSVVDVGPDGSFDERGIVKPTVIHDASATPAYRMFYGALGDAGNTIGSATSTDGVNWMKVEDPTGTPAPVLRPGTPGSADGYAVGEPSVTYANGIYRMWYAAYPSPDVSGRQVGYATSTDGVNWSKGGVVTLSGSEGNWDGGWFSPGAWYQEPDPHRMLFAGKKPGAQPYKLIWADSADGLDWSANNIVLNVGSTGTFDENNLFWSSLLYQPSGSPTHRIFYTGNGGAGDLSRNAIGYASWGGGGGATRIGVAVQSSTAPARFDGHQTSGASIVATGGPSNLIYAGRSADDVKWRIGRAVASGSTWNKIDGTGDGITKAVFALGGGAAHDRGGALWPSVATTNSGTSYAMAYEAWSNATPPVQSIGVATAMASSFDSWTRNASAVLSAGTGFYSSKVSHPSLVVPGGGDTKAYLFFAGHDGVDWEIGVATGTASGALTAWSTGSSVLTKGSSGSFDAVGAYDPAVAYDVAASPPWRMFYTGEDAAGVQRLGYATSGNGLTWTKQGMVVDASGKPYAFDELGARAAGAWYESGASTWHVFFDGVDRGNKGGSAGSPPISWRRVGHATGTGSGYVASGRAAYELAPTAPTASGYGYEFRGFDFDDVVPAGASTRYEVSYYPAYVTASGSPVDAWSEYVRWDTSPTPTLPITTKKVRWRVTFDRGTAGAAARPQLDECRAHWAPVSFATNGSAMSVPVGPPGGKYVDVWQNLQVKSRIPAGTAVNVTVFDPDGGVLVPTRGLSNGTTNVSLAAVPQGLQYVRVRFDLSGTGGATPYVDNWQASYVSTDRAPVVGLTALGRDQKVLLSWTNPVYASYAGARLLRKLGSFPANATDTAATVLWEEMGTPGASIATTDTSVTPGVPLSNGTPYYYAAYTFAVDATTSARLYSPPAKAVAIPKKPIAPFKAVAGTSKVTLVWTNPTMPATYTSQYWRGAVIMRRTGTWPTGTRDASATPVLADSMLTSFVDTNVANGTTYYYAAFVHDRVRDGARDYDGYSEAALAAATPKLPVSMALKLQRFNRYRRPYYRYARGRTVYAYGTVKPNHARFEGGARGYVYAYAYQKKRVYDRRRRRYVYAWKRVAYSKRYLTRYRTYSYWRWAWRPRSKGTYYIRAYFRGDALHFARWSPTANLLVY